MAWSNNLHLHFPLVPPFIFISFYSNPRPVSPLFKSPENLLFSLHLVPLLPFFYLPPRPPPCSSGTCIRHSSAQSDLQQNTFSHKFGGAGRWTHEQWPARVRSPTNSEKNFVAQSSSAASHLGRQLTKMYKLTSNFWPMRILPASTKHITRQLIGRSIRTLLTASRSGNAFTGQMSLKVGHFASLLALQPKRLAIERQLSIGHRRGTPTSHWT